MMDFIIIIQLLYQFKKMNIPATFYITTDFINKNITSWIDRIEMAVNNIDSGTTKYSKKNRF